MKTFRNILFFTIISTVFLSSASGQSIILKNFSLSRLNKKVFLRWTISEGETCNGIEIQRSTDSLNFNQIGDISGVCGSPDFAQSYEFIDEHPVKNRTNYYRLVLGNTGFSNVLSIDIFIPDRSGILILPNPASESTTVYFDNPHKAAHILRLYSVNGKQILEMTGNKTFFEVSTSPLKSGMYVLSIIDPDDNSHVRAKMVVAH